MATAPTVRPRLGRVAIGIAVASAALLAIGGVVLSRSMKTATRRSMQVNTLIADLRFARAQAMVRGMPVVTCASSDGATCSNSNDWQRGWMVCFDVNSSGRCDAGDPVSRVQKAFDGSDSFTASGNTSAIQFNREGFSIGLTGTVTITLHDASGAPGYTHCVQVSAVGTVRLQKAGQGDCQ
jgi:type IV fimbrial biogenesis protein FimT